MAYKFFQTFCSIIFKTYFRFYFSSYVNDILQHFRVFNLNTFWKQVSACFNHSAAFSHIFNTLSGIYEFLMEDRLSSGFWHANIASFTWLVLLAMSIYFCIKTLQVSADQRTEWDPYYGINGARRVSCYCTDDVDIFQYQSDHWDIDRHFCMQFVFNFSFIWRFVCFGIVPLRLHKRGIGKYVFISRAHTITNACKAVVQPINSDI